MQVQDKVSCSVVTAKKEQGIANNIHCVSPCNPSACHTLSFHLSLFFNQAERTCWCPDFKRISLLSAPRKIRAEYYIQSAIYTQIYTVHTYLFCQKITTLFNKLKGTKGRYTELSQCDNIIL